MQCVFNCSVQLGVKNRLRCVKHVTCYARFSVKTRTETHVVASLLLDFNINWNGSTKFVIKLRENQFRDSRRVTCG